MTYTFEPESWLFYRDDESEAQAVRVPHDAMLGERRGPDAPSGNAGAYFYGGCYRYEMLLEMPLDYEHKVLTLEFEGAMGDTTVLVDGEVRARHVYGYTGFSVDLSDLFSRPGKHLLCVRVDNTQQPNSRWYAGSGLYRPVRMVIQDPTHILRGGVRVSTESLDPARVRVQTSFAGDAQVNVVVVAQGEVICAGAGADCVLEIPDAHLWSADDPFLYDLYVALEENDQVVDVAHQRLGVRKLAWGRSGLLVNGSPVKLRGGCVHHDNGILGAVDLPQASFRKVARLKEWGFNAIRSAHNPLSESMLAACDELGMYVMDELCDMWYRPKNPYDYSRDFEACYTDDLRAMVAKDFNHPSVVLYSIGNENAEPVEQRGVEMARTLAQLTWRLDPTRPVTAGVNPTILWAAGLGIDSFNGEGSDEAPTQDASTDASLAYNTYVAKMGDVMELIASTPLVGNAVRPFFDALDIAGYNYGVSRYHADLRRRPDQLIFGSETMPYDLARNWRLVEGDPRIIGDFMWTSWDYLGECSLAAWSDDPTPVAKPYPWLCADTGALDLIGDPNGEAALAAVVWEAPVMAQDPLIFVRPADLPHPVKAPWRGTNSIPCWSWRGSEGNPTVVEVYTRAPIVKLYLNGRSVRVKRVHDGHADFSVRYQPGELVAIACTARGEELGRSLLRSAEGPLHLSLRVEPDVWGEMQAQRAAYLQGLDAGDLVLMLDKTADDKREDDGERVSFVSVTLVDERGTVEAGCDRELRVAVAGGELLAFGSAIHKSERSYLEGCFPTRAGRALAVVRHGPGRCMLRATDGVDEAFLEL